MRLVPPVSLKLAVVVGLGALALASCGDSAPVSSTPPTTVPAPTPTSPPTGGGGGDSYYDASCPLGEGDADASCARGGERMLNVYEDALDNLIETQPAIFDLNNENAPGTKAYFVKDKEAFMTGIVRYVRGRGLCAERDPDDGAQETIRMKLSSDFSENYDTLLSSGHMRRGMGAYRETCTPANFPVEREDDAPPIGSGCGRPYPPPVTRINCKIHTKGPEYYTLDSTPIVGHNAAYCASVGFTDGRSLCPVRPEGWADREACEAWRVGNAQDTGRPGPTWRRNGSFCTGPESGCQNHPGNQYQLWSYNSMTGGIYTVSAENGASCTVDPF
jgi:hypothetical protein